jgi:glyoxylase-like metal-dependent hydrolase (beta-lactamase superfamily II)
VLVLVGMAAKTVRKVLDNFYWIVAREGMLPDSNIFLVKDGDRFALFDAGIHHFFKDTVDAIKELGLELKQMDRLILTHTHLDHSGATPEFKGRLKDLEVWVLIENSMMVMSSK